MERYNKVLKPTVGSALSFGWSVLWEKFITIFLILLVVWAAYFPMSVLENYEEGGFGATLLGAFSFLYYMFALSPISYSADFLMVKAVRGFKLDVRELFDVFKNYLNVVLANLLALAIIGIGFAFLIVPGIIFACRLAFVSYLVLDKKMDPVRAVEESWRLTRGHGWRILWFYISSFFIVIAGFIVFIFGMLISLMWIQVSFAALYQAVLEKNGEYEMQTDNSDGLINDSIPVAE